METATPVTAPIQQAVPAVSGSPASMPPPPAAAPAPAVTAAPGAVGAAIPQPQPSPPVGGTPGTPGAAVPSTAAPVVSPSQSPEYQALQREHQRVLAEIQRLTPYAAIGYRQQAAAPAAPAATPAATAEPRLGVPELDPMVAAYLVEQNGQMVEIPGAPPGTLAAYQRHQREMATFLRSFTQNPERALAPVVDKIRKDAIEEAKKVYAGEVKAAQDKAQAAAILQENAAWMYERDGAGNVVVDFDPLTGRQSQRLSEGGQWWMEAVKGLSEQGVSDPAVLNAYAKAQAHLRAWQRHQEASRQAPAAVPADPPAAPAAAHPFNVPGIVPAAPAAAPNLAAMVMADPKMAFLSQVPGATPGQYNPPPAGSMAPALPARTSVNPIQSWKAAAIQALYANGHSPNSRLPVGAA